MLAGKNPRMRMNDPPPQNASHASLVSAEKKITADTF
jgi:hypothetical protein